MDEMTKWILSLGSAVFLLIGGISGCTYAGRQQTIAQTAQLIQALEQCKDPVVRGDLTDQLYMLESRSGFGGLSTVETQNLHEQMVIRQILRSLGKSPEQAAALVNGQKVPTK